MARASLSRFGRRLGIFAGAGICAHGFLALAFALVCMVGGHNTMEMIYGGTASYVIAVAVGLEVAVLSEI